MSAAMLRVMLRLAWRSLVAHRVTTGIVGSIIFFGTSLVVVGTSMLDSVERSMTRSIVSSIAGHLQLYASDAKDDLALFGSGFMGVDDVGEIRQFGEVKRVVQSVPNVKAVVPMGIQFTTVASPNEIDKVLERLRAAVHRGDARQIDALSAQVRGIAEDLAHERERALAIAADPDKVKEQLGDLARVGQPEFWERLAVAPEEQLQFLETRVAPLSMDGQLIYLRNLGTDLQRFSKLFDRFEVVEGTMVPPGRRGFLVAKRVLEKQLKHKVARELDLIREGLHEENKTLATDAVLGDKAKRLPGQYRRIAFQLPPEVTESVLAALKKVAKTDATDAKGILQAFLAVDDTNFDERYDAFYQSVAPHIDLYALRPGETVALRAVTKSGYLKSVNVNVYGVFQFKSLEKSDLAGAQNLVDLATFRELYGVMTEEKKQELATIRSDVGAADVERDDVESVLFAGGSIELGTPETDDFDAFDEFDTIDLEAARQARQDASRHLFDPDRIDEGLALNAAVLLDDGERLTETKQAIETAISNAGINVKVVKWQEATGIVGQLIVVIRMILYVAIFVIFLVAAVIINNAMVMATMDRITEIGTMRALGAQRGFVMVLFLAQTVALALVAGTLGAVAGAGLIGWLNHHGLPATSNILVFLFSGPRLHPDVGLANLVSGFVTVMLVALVSTLYPARLATRIQPVAAMQVKE